jgi:hypothetical protein
VLNWALAAAVVLISRRLYRIEDELERVKAQVAAAGTRADGARANPPLAPGHAAMTDGPGDMADLAAEWEQAILPTDS